MPGKLIEHSAWRPGRSSCEREGAKRKGTPRPRGPARLSSEAPALPVEEQRRAAQHRQEPARRLRVVATPSSAAAVGLEASLAPLGPAAERTAVSLRTWTVPGGLGAHKWTDRRGIDAAAERLDATPLIIEPGAEVLEAGWGNVWALEGTRLVTPPADGRILPGVTRERLLGLAGERGLEAAEERLSLERLARADAILLTSSLRLAVPGELAGEPDGKGAEVAEAIGTALMRASRG